MQAVLTEVVTRTGLAVVVSVALGWLVSSALADQLRIMHHHCARPILPRAASVPHRLQDGINYYNIVRHKKPPP